jgi:hypothetical protein
MDVVDRLLRDRPLFHSKGAKRWTLPGTLRAIQRSAHPSNPGQCPHLDPRPAQTSRGGIGYGRSAVRPSAKVYREIVLAMTRNTIEFFIVLRGRETAINSSPSYAV